MTQKINLAGLELQVLDPNLGAGGQGKAQLVAPASDPATKLVLKELPIGPDTEARVRWLCDQNFTALTPAIAAPIVSELTGHGTILHLASLAPGDAQDEAAPRALPHNLQICLEFVCLIQRLEEAGIVHGDIAPSNIFIADDGAVSLIDFDGFLALDPSVPPPDTIGQRPMLAPEQRNGSAQRPTVESGYFQMAMLMSMILTGHYPTEGLPSEPAAVDQLLSQGHWPEHDRTPDPDDLPINALGSELVTLFDQAFSLDPSARPNPDTWRRALTRALHNCWVHDCGQAFVAAATTTQCPGCGAAVKIPNATKELKIQILPNGPRYGVEIKNRTPIILGRATMPGLPPTVSGRHLEILPYQGRLLLRHVGSNPTLIQQNSRWYRISELWLDRVGQSDMIQLMLAESEITLTIEQR